mmetsp:Transcript_85568/g.149171  ORF Transcript_85568/g.149171 Transcript_85568/m.149171 type:complete len:2183 (+) Transcript_85568:355-6903(+)
MELRSRARFETYETDLSKFDGVFSKDELESLRNIFQELHANCSGPLRLEDLQQFIANNGGTMDTDEVLDQWRSIDISGDGYVHEEEFLTWMARAKGLALPHTEAPQSEVPQAEAPRTTAPRFSMWGSQESLARRIKEEDESKDDDETKQEHRRESDDKMEVHVDMSALTADLENLREQLDNERQRRQDLEAELYDLAVTRDADMGGAVPIAEYEKLRLAEQLAQEKLMHLTEQSAEFQQSEQREGIEVNRPQEDHQASREAALKRRSTLRRPSWYRMGRASWLYRRGSRSSRSGSRRGSRSLVQFVMGEGEGEGGGNMSSSTDSDSKSDKSQISMSFKKEVRKKSTVIDEKSLDPALEQATLKKEIQEVLSEVRASFRVQDTATDKVAVSLADKVLTLLREDSVNVISASDVANRAAQIVQEQRQSREVLESELPLGAQVELANVRRSICSGLEHELEDVQTQLRSCVAASHMAVAEQSDLCERLAEQAKQLRLAVETLPPPFVSPVPPAENVNALAESMAEHLSEQLASIHAETAEVKSAVASAVTTLRSTLSSQQAVAAKPLPKEDKDYFLVFSFDKLGLVDRINEAAFMQEFRERLQNLGAKAASLENIVLSREGGSLLASVFAPAATVRALEKLPLAGNVIIMGDMARVAPAVSEARRLNQSVSAELQGLRVQLEELAGSQPARPPTEPLQTTPGFEGLWTAVVGQDNMVVGFQSAGAKCRAERWLRDHGIRSVQQLVFADVQEGFLNALQLDPVHQDRAFQWLKRQTMEAMSQRASEALMAACSCRERTKLEEALRLAEKANLQNDCQFEMAKAALREVWEEMASQRTESLEAAYKIAVPPAFGEIVSHVLLISGSDVADEETQRLCDEAAFRSWVKWVPDDLSASQGNPETAFLRCQGRLTREVEARLCKMPPASHFTFIFLSTSPFAHCTQEKLVDIANYIKLEVAGKSQLTLNIGVCGFSHLEDCRRYLQEQACEQRRLHDALRSVETLRSELKESDSELSEQQIEDLQQRLGAELENVCAMRKWAEQAMSSLRLQHLDKERRRLESDKERSVMETKALDMPASGLENIQKQERGIEALQATNAKVSDYTRADADSACQHADKLIALVRSHVEAVKPAQGPDSQEKSPMRAMQATERPQALDSQALPLALQAEDTRRGELLEPSERAATTELGSAELEEMLTTAVLRARDRNVKLTPLSWASVHMKAKVGSSGSEPQVIEKIKMAVVEEAARSNVSLADIAASKVDGAVYCTVRIADSTSVLATVEALRAHRWRAEGLREVLEAAGVTDLQIAPKWPLERIQAEIRLSYGYKLDRADLFAALVPVLADSDDLYSRAWERACWEAPTALQALVQMESMALFEDQASSARFKDQLLPISQGRERGLAEVSLRQGTRNLRDLMCDAAVVHRQLKNRLLPGASWSEAELNDTQAVPPGHVVRTWHSSSLDPAPCGAHYDPGLEREDRVLAAARRMIRALDVEPRLDLVFNTSRLDIVFESAECLRNAVDWLIKNLDVVWLENRFRNPSCLGGRDITIGIRWLVADCNLTNPPLRVHINELQLSLKELHDKKREDGCRLCGEICSGLAKCGVQAKDLNDVWKLILHLLDCTDGQAALNAQRHLAYVVELASSMACRSEGSIAVLAKELVEEAALQAMAAGVAADDVNRMKATLSRVTMSAALALPSKDAAPQLSREGASAMSGTTSLPESGESCAWQQCREDHSATMATPMSLTQSMQEQLQILSEAVEPDDPASPQLSRETAPGSCSHLPVFSEELLQLRTQIAGLKEHAEQTEQLRETVLQMLHTSVEPLFDSSQRERDGKHEVSAGRRKIPKCPGVAEERRREVQHTGNIGFMPEKQQVDKWHRQRQGRWSRWLRELQQNDSMLLPAASEIEGKLMLEEQSHAESEAEDNDQGLYMLELLQRLKRQAPHWEADMRFRSAQGQPSEKWASCEAGDHKADNAVRPGELEEEPQARETAVQDADTEQEEIGPHLQEEACKQISEQAVPETLDERRKGEKKLDSKAGGQRESMKELLHHEERLRQEARLERVLQRLQERLLVQEQGQPTLEARAVQGPGELSAVHDEPQSLPCQSLPHLQLPERLGITCGSSFTAAPATPPPALRDERPRAQGAIQDLSPPGLPSLRPTARFAERANLETHPSCGANNLLPLDISAVATA